MPRIQFVAADGSILKAEAAEGQTLMSAAVHAGIDAILAECGGACACGTCHCYIDPAWLAKLPDPAANEAAMLECVIDPTLESRLSCQIRLTAALDGLVVRLPPSQY